MSRAAGRATCDRVRTSTCGLGGGLDRHAPSGLREWGCGHYASTDCEWPGEYCVASNFQGPNLSLIIALGAGKS